MAQSLNVVLEVNASRITVFVQETDDVRNIRIIGLGISPFAGMHKGQIIDPEKAADSIRNALAKAEETGRVCIRKIYLLIAGTHVDSLLQQDVAEQDWGGIIAGKTIDQIIDIVQGLSMEIKDVLLG